jgi:segregation and condensation protein B
MPDFKNQLEALLFASGRFMSVDILMSLTGASNKQVINNNMAKLKQEYDSRGSPMMIIEEKDGWKLTVREEYLPMVRKIISETELPKTMLETLAVIAWKAPVLQSEVVDIRHNKAYDHIAELEELGFIKKEMKGRSYLIMLTEKFFEYFDIEGAKDIREVLAKVVGKGPQSKVEDFKAVSAGIVPQEPEKKDEYKPDSPKERPTSTEGSELDDLEGQGKDEGEEFSEL